MLRRPTLMSVSLVLVLIAAACQGEESPQTTQEATGDGEQGSPTQLVILAEDVPIGLDYDGPAVPIPTSQTGMVNLMEGLIGYARGGENEEGVGLLDFNRFEGRLAESWEFDESTLTWTFHLRQGVVGCDGATFNADDVIYTFARAKSVSGALPIGWFEANTAGIDGFTPEVFEDEAQRALGDEVSKIDDFTVQIRQSSPPSQLFLPVYAQWAGVMIFDKETMEANATDEDPWSHEYVDNENAPSFGAYCLESWEKEREFIVQANPQYYRGEPAIDRVIYRKVPESSNRLAALQSGDADIVEHLTPREFDSLRGVDGIGVAGVFGNETLILQLNWKNQPFENESVRKAIAHAIPYEQIINDGYFGAARKWEGQIPSTYVGFHRSATQYDYNPERARQLLVDAGYPGGSGLESFSDSFNLVYIAEKESILGPIATTMQAALRDVGIPVELDPIPQAQFADRLYTKRDIAFALDDIEKAVPVDGGYNLLIWHHSGMGTANNNQFADPRVDELILAANVEADPEERNAILAEAQDILMGYPNLLPIVESKTQWAFDDSVQGITWHPENSLHWFDLSFAN